MSEEIWKEIIPNILWTHTKCDVHIRNENGRMFFYDKSKMDVMFPINDLLESPALSLLPQIADLKNRSISLRNDVNFLFTNQAAQFLEVPAVVDLYRCDLGTMSGERANNRGIPNKFKAIGFISENKNAGEVARLQLTGTIENADWNWTKGEDVFLYSNTLSHLPKMTDSTFIQKVAQAVTTTKLLISIRDPIILS